MSTTAATRCAARRSSGPGLRSPAWPGSPRSSCTAARPIFCMESRLKSPRNRIVLVIVLVAVAALIWFGRGRIHFNWAVFVNQLRQAEWSRIALALASIYLGYVFRAARWALLIRHLKKVPLFSLLGTQVIGFTAVALIGRVADPVRPYLVAKKTGLPLSTQFAV